MEQLDWAKNLNPNQFKKSRRRLTVEELEEAYRLQEARQLAQRGISLVGRM